jgi:predicted transcriptional regulator
MTEKVVIELEIRRKIYNYIVKYPGLHVRELSRALNIPLSTLDYHLYFLRRRNLIQDQSDGRYTRYYAVGTLGIGDKGALAMLRQTIPRKIIMFLLLYPRSFHREISNHLGLAPSTTTFHLRKLVELHVVKRIKIGRETHYQVREPEMISDLLIVYQRSFLDTAVDRFIDTWLELNPKYIRKYKKKKK